jgi:hypothetical protein
MMNIALLRMVRDFSSVTRKGVPLTKDAAEVLAVIKTVMK